MTNYKIKIEDVVSNYRTVADTTEALCVPMLKANAYGLGAQRVLSALETAGVTTFALSRLEEALELETESTLWVLTCYHGADELRLMLEQDFVFAVDSVEQAKLADELAAEIDNINEKARAEGGVFIDTLVAGIEEGKRSFKIVRAKPDGKSYARDIAERYGLTYENILKKIGK